MVQFYTNFHYTGGCKAAVCLHMLQHAHLYPESAGRVDYLGGGCSHRVYKLWGASAPPPAPPSYTMTGGFPE